MLPETSVHPAHTPEERQPWHKPEIERLRVSLDTGIGTGSVEDMDGFEFSTPSDRRLKRDIAEIENALGYVLSARHVDPAEYVQVLPMLVEAIKQQQAMIEELRTQIGKAR